MTSQQSYCHKNPSSCQQESSNIVEFIIYSSATKFRSLDFLLSLRFPTSSQTQHIEKKIKVNRKKNIIK